MIAGRNKQRLTSIPDASRHAFPFCRGFRANATEPQLPPPPAKTLPSPPEGTAFLLHHSLWGKYRTAQRNFTIMSLQNATIDYYTESYRIKVKMGYMTTSCTDVWEVVPKRNTVLPTWKVTGL